MRLGGVQSCECDHQTALRSTPKPKIARARPSHATMAAASLTSPTGNSFENKYAEELIQTARAIAAPGKGILAADESTGTIGKRVRNCTVFPDLCIRMSAPMRPDLPPFHLPPPHQYPIHPMHGPADA